MKESYQRGKDSPRELNMVRVLHFDNIRPLRAFHQLQGTVFSSMYMCTINTNKPKSPLLLNGFDITHSRHNVYDF